LSKYIYNNTQKKLTFLKMIFSKVFKIIILYLWIHSYIPSLILNSRIKNNANLKKNCFLIPWNKNNSSSISFYKHFNCLINFFRIFRMKFWITFINLFDVSFFPNKTFFEMINTLMYIFVIHISSVFNNVPITYW